MKTRIIIGIICLFIIMTFGSCIYYSDPFIWVSPMRCIRGEIIDFDTNKPLTDIEITNTEENQIVYTDSVGSFHIHLDQNYDGYTLLINNNANNGYSQKDTIITDSIYNGEKIIIYLTKQQ